MGGIASAARAGHGEQSTSGADLRAPYDDSDAVFGDRFDADLLQKRALSQQEQDEIPMHLLDNGLVLASTGSGGSGSGGGMYWDQKYLVYDKISRQVWTIYYRGDDYSGGSVSAAGPTAVATHTFNATKEKFNSVTAAARHILPEG